MRRLLAVILALALSIGMLIPSTVQAEGLNDLEDSAYKMEIEKLVEDGTILGYEDGTFRPKNSITRGELAKILAVTLKLEENKEAAAHFVDVVGKWHQGYIGALYNANIMIGISADKFGAANNVTREELAVILLRIFELEEIANELNLELEFDDAEEIATWAKNAVAFAHKIGLMDGIKFEDGSYKFSPKKFGERELVAKLVYELKYNKEYYEEVISKIRTTSNVGDIEEPTDNQDNNQGDGEQGKEIPSYESIVSKYYNMLTSLEASVNSRIDELIAQAKEEYKNGVPYEEIYKKYMAIVKSFEAEVDSKVNSILSNLMAELSKYGYETSVVDEFRSYYESVKSSISF